MPTERVRLVATLRLAMARLVRSTKGRVLIAGVSAFNLVLWTAALTESADRNDLGGPIFVLGYGLLNVLGGWWIRWDEDPSRSVRYRDDDVRLKADLSIAGGLGALVMGLLGLAVTIASVTPPLPQGRGSCRQVPLPPRRGAPTRFC